jgi:uncharacterized protein (DUF1778 family)
VDQEHKSSELGKFDIQVASVEACNIDDVKKSFAGLADREDLHLDPDLMYAKFIMCHEGANANGDYFTKDVLFRSQYTPRFKPIDWEHGQPMIGTILDSHYLEDAQGRGYIEAIGVIWKFIYPEMAEQIKSQSATGGLKLSMECYFKDANYKYGEQIFDQEQSEELGLADYVGREYMGQKVFRVFKDVIFGGVGVVANPADKGAVFLAVAKKQAQEVIENNEIVNNLSDEQIKAIAEIIRNTNDFRDKLVDKDTFDAVTVAKFVKVFDKAKSDIVSRFNKDSIATKEQLVSEVRSIIELLLTDVSNINNDLFVGRASEGSDELEVVILDLNLKLCDQCVSIEEADENKGGSEQMEENQIQEVVAEEVVEETVVAEETTEEVAVVEEVVVSEDVPAETVVEEVVDTVDYQAQASSLAETVERLEGELKKVTDSYQALLTKVEASEKEALVEARMAELKESGIEFSEARKAKEIEKVSAMDNESFADYKDFLAELTGTVVKEVVAEEVVEEAEEVIEEVEVEVEADTATAGLNIETELPKAIKPFSHLAE